MVNPPPKDREDIIEDVLRVCLDLAPGFSAAIARQVEAQVRPRWAGDRPYIRDKTPEMQRQERNAVIRREHQAGAAISQLERRHRLSRAQIWRIVNWS